MLEQLLRAHFLPRGLGLQLLPEIVGKTHLAPVAVNLRAIEEGRIAPAGLVSATAFAEVEANSPRRQLGEPIRIRFLRGRKRMRGKGSKLYLDGGHRDGLYLLRYR